MITELILESKAPMDASIAQIQSGHCPRKEDLGEYPNSISDKVDLVSNTTSPIEHTSDPQEEEADRVDPILINPLRPVTRSQHCIYKRNPKYIMSIAASELSPLKFVERTLESKE